MKMNARFNMAPPPQISGDTVHEHQPHDRVPWYVLYLRVASEPAGVEFSAAGSMRAVFAFVLAFLALGSIEAFSPLRTSCVAFKSKHKMLRPMQGLFGPSEAEVTQ